MLELFFRKSLIFFTDKITKMLRKMVTGQMMIVAAAVILNKAASLITHTCIGGQSSSDSIWLEALAARSVLLGFIQSQYHLVRKINNRPADINGVHQKTDNSLRRGISTSRPSLTVS